MTNNTSGINTDQSKWTEAWDSHKLQVPGLSYNWWGFQAWDAFQDSTDNSRIDKVETSLEWQSISLSWRYDWCAPLSYPSSNTLVNYEPSQQSSKEEYKPRKWGATARHHQRMVRPGVHQVPEGSGEQGKMEETGYEIVCGAPKTLLCKDRWWDDVLFGRSAFTF